MRLHSDWKLIWKRISVQCMGYALAFMGWWQGLEVGNDLKIFIGTKWALVILCTLLVVGIIGSAIDQPNTRKP